MRGRACRCLLFALSLSLGCTTVRHDMRRAEAAFAEARYEDVEAWLADLEPSLGAMDPTLRARFYYLAGMSAYRIGELRRARHALALCREEVEANRVRLPPAWVRNLESALEELGARRETNDDDARASHVKAPRTGRARGAKEQETSSVEARAQRFDRVLGR